MLEIAIPLPADFARLPALPGAPLAELCTVAELPSNTSDISPDLLRFQHFLWLLGELEPGISLDLPYPWTGLLALRGHFTHAHARLSIFRRTHRAAEPAELFQLHLTLDPATCPLTRESPLRFDPGPLAVLIRNSRLSMAGELRFLERNKSALASAAIALLLTRRQAPLELDYAHVH